MFTFASNRAAIFAVVVSCSVAFPSVAAEPFPSTGLHPALGKGWDGQFGIFSKGDKMLVGRSATANAAPRVTISTKGMAVATTPTTKHRHYIRLDGHTEVAKLKSLIAGAEAGAKGYDAIHYSAKSLPRKRPTQMTLGEVFAWIRATPGQNHAIGRYQFIPSTLRMLVSRANLSMDTRFSKGTQDRLADMLLQDAGFLEFKKGQISKTAFMNNLARIWAGLPTSSGRSAYHGYAGNAATISWSEYDRHMATIFQ